MWRSEKYRRLIATLPCVNCGLEGSTQAAHINFGKGFGLKTSDATCVPLCADRPGTRGCHSTYDSGKDLTRDERRLLALEWLSKTHIQMIEEGALKWKS